MHEQNNIETEQNCSHLGSEKREVDRLSATKKQTSGAAVAIQNQLDQCETAVRKAAELESVKCLSRVLKVKA